MLVIGRRFPIFSCTNSGRTKSWAFRFVSRTRLRSAGERRKRRGRWTNFLTERGYSFGDCVASSPRDESVRLADLTRCSVPWLHGADGARVQLPVDRHQQLIHQSCVCQPPSNCPPYPNRNEEANSGVSAFLFTQRKDRHLRR